jgi:hypothetical protein
MAQGWRTFLSDWGEYRFEVEEYRELDDERIVVLLSIAGRGKTSGWSSEQSGPGAPTSSRSAAGR